MQIRHKYMNYSKHKSSYKALIVVFLLVFGFASTSMGQASEKPKEQVIFHTPKTLYFTGEKIWFEASVSLGDGASSSQVLYAELIDRNSTSILHVKVPLQEGLALNFIQLSEQVPSDHYLLRVYTRISPYLDLNQGIAQQFVTVINPKIPPKAIAPTSSWRTTSEKNYPKGSQVQLAPTAGARVRASGISVANPFLAEEQAQWVSEDMYASLVPQPLLPELFGHLVQAKVSSLDTSLTYFLSLHGSKSALYTDHADENGRLVFDAGGLRHWDRLILQLENGEEMPGLELLSPLIKTTFRKPLDFPVLSLVQEDIARLQPLLKASVVQARYLEEVRQDSLEVVTGFVADYTFDLDAYTRFETTETVLKEYVPSVSVRLREKKKTFRLVNEANKNVFEDNPLILVDAMPVFDSDLLASFNPKFLQKLEILNREFYLNDRTYAGVLSFSSYGNNFGLFPLAPAARFFDYQGLRPALLMDRDQFQRSSTATRIPDWRTVLYWGAGGENVSTQMPALTGMFVYWEQVTVEGRSTTLRRYFEIKP